MVKLEIAMDWDKTFCVYRIVEDKTLEPVFVTNDMKKAKYWLTYIAEYGDALCRTPSHPKNDTEEPVYWQHKEDDRATQVNQERWEKLAEEKNCTLTFIAPTEDLS